MPFRIVPSLSMLTVVLLVFALLALLVEPEPLPELVADAPPAQQFVPLKASVTLLTVVSTIAAAIESPVVMVLLAAVLPDASLSPVTAPNCKSLLTWAVFDELT